MRMAADHGRAILVHAGGGSDASIVSLGPPANDAAKQLPESEAHAVRVRADFISSLLGVDGRKNWENINLDTYSTIAQLIGNTDQQTEAKVCEANWEPGRGSGTITSVQYRIYPSREHWEPCRWHIYIARKSSRFLYAGGS